MSPTPPATISPLDWLAFYRSLGWDRPTHVMHPAYQQLLTEVVGGRDA